MAYYSRLGAFSNDLVTDSPAPWSWEAGGAIPLDMRAVETYVAQHPRVFVVDSLLAGDAADVKARAREKAASIKQTIAAKRASISAQSGDAGGGGNPGRANAAVAQATARAQQKPIPTAAIAAFVAGFLIGRISASS